MNATFLQPRHVYAPEEGNGRIHLSSPLIVAAARVKAAGYKGDIEIRDENFEAYKANEPLDADIVGINLIILNGNIDTNVQAVLGIENMPAQESVSQISIWETIPDSQWIQYLSREISLYVSQGCKYKCSFCTAKNGMPEEYRNSDVMEEDIIWLANKAKSLGLNELSFYASNLDVFQKPRELENFANMLIRASQRTGAQINWRGLATVKSFKDAPDELVLKVKESGFTSVGLGVDGLNVWETVNKKHNGSVEDCENALRKARTYGFTPEILMVYGHPADTAETMQAANDFCGRLITEIGAVARPHAAKSSIVGTDAWREDRDLAERFLSDPAMFQALDYKALLTPTTTGLTQERCDMINKFFIHLCENGGDSSPWITPDTPEFRSMAAAQGTTVKALNKGKFDR